MKIWVLTMEVGTAPDRKIYLLGAHSSREGADKQKQEVDDPPVNVAHIIEMVVDERQPPVVIGVASPGLPSECKKNLPND